MKKIAFLVAYDSYIKPAASIKKQLESGNVIVDLIFIKFINNRISERQLLGNLFSAMTESKFLNQSSKYSTVFLGVGGKEGYNLNIKIKKSDCKIKVVTLFPGLCHYNKNIGFLYRSISDLILFNNSQDYSDYKVLGSKLGFSTENAMLYGLAYLKGNQIGKIKEFDDVKNITYFDQEIIPRSKNEKLYILDKLKKLAMRYPDKQIFIKPRKFHGEVSSHNSNVSLLGLYIDNKLKLPKNLKLATRDIYESLNDADLVVSISSTALIEAITMGKLACSISDFIHKPEYSASFFLTSGISNTFDSIIQGKSKFSVNEEWAHKYITFPNRNSNLQLICFCIKSGYMHTYADICFINRKIKKYIFFCRVLKKISEVVAKLGVGNKII